MLKIIYLIILLSNSFSQSHSFYSAASIPNNWLYVDGTDTIFIKHENPVKDTTYFTPVGSIQVQIKDPTNENWSYLFESGNNSLIVKIKEGPKVKLSKRGWYWRKASLYLDDKKPNRIYINFLLHDKNPDPNVTYFADLKNRQKIVFWKNSFTLSPIIIPFKYRFKEDKRIYEKDSTSDTVFVAKELLNDFNVSVNISYILSRSSYKYIRGSKISPLNFGIAINVFGGFTKVELDKETTSLHKDKFKYSNIVPGLTFGYGLTLQMEKLKTGFYYGYDFALSGGGQWNHHSEPWIGFGLGYGLNFNIFQ